MTTLPQTTNSRLARPPALMSPQGHALASHPSLNSVGMTGNDVWRVIRANLVLIFLSVAIATAAGFAVNWFLAKNYPRYTSTGYVSLSLPVIYNPLTRTYDRVDDYNLTVEQRTASSLLKSDALISRVLQNPNSKLRTTTWFKQFNLDTAQAKQDLIRNFSASPIENSKLIAVSMSASNADDCKTIVEDIVFQHLETQKNLVRDKTFDKRTTLQNLQSRLNTTIARLQEDQRQKAIKLGASGVQASGKMSEAEMQLNRLVEAELSYTTSFNNAKIMLERVTQLLASGGTVGEAEEAVNKDSSIANYRAQIDSIDTELFRYHNVGDENQTKKTILARRQYVQDKLDQRSAELRITATQGVLDEAKGRQQVAQQQLDDTRKQIEKIKGELGDLTVAMTDYLNNQDLIEGYRKDLSSIDNQLQGLDPSASSQSGIDWATRPERPDVPSFPKLSITLSMAVAVGLSLSLGIAFLREIMDTTVRSPRDIAKVGQLSMLGMIPHRDDDPQAEGAALPLVIFQAPTSIMAEQYRQVRTRLQHAASLDTTRSILVTSPSPGDGKSVVACNLAASLALNGRRILLVDANFRRPDVHKIFGVNNVTGLSDALNSIENLEGAVQRTAVPNLDVLTTGSKPENATELLESQSMIDLIERALEEYDHVVFDSGPLLVVSETVALAPRVDGVITVVRASTNSRGLLTRMRDSLRQLKAEHLGVVLNGVRSQGGGYYGRNIKTYYEYQSS